MIVTIDGPAGAGKSTTARALGTSSGLSFSRYRGHVPSRRVCGSAAKSIVGYRRPSWSKLAEQLELEVSEDQVLIDGQDATAEIRTQEVTDVTHYAANNPGVRASWSNDNERWPEKRIW